MLKFIKDTEIKYKNMLDKAKYFASNNSFDKIKIEELNEQQKQEPVLVNYYYFYLIGLFRLLYKFRDNIFVLKKLTTINNILFYNLEFFKSSIRNFEYIQIKAYNDFLKQGKDKDTIKQEADLSFSKINFEHIIQNRKTLEYLNKKAKTT